MTAGCFFRDKLLHIALSAFGALFAGVFLAVLRVPPAAVGFLVLVFLLCSLLPLFFEGMRKLRFYRETAEQLDALEEKYLLSELVNCPDFSEGVFFCTALREVNKSMADRVGAARRDMGEYREYIETWIHEVKTPIASARLVLENHPGDFSDALEDELFRIDCYVEQALFYARSGAVDRDHAVRAFALRAAASAAVRRYARPLIEAGFRIDLPSLDAVVCADPKWVEFILGQLISNAIKYRGASPLLSFSQRVEKNSVALLLQDNGAGIPPEDLPRVFDKGFTGENGRALGVKSTGLGLYLCKKLTTRLGLELSLRAAPGGGTEAELLFPRAALPYKTVTQA